jgi:trk system potassium uptake protein TrkA
MKIVIVGCGRVGSTLAENLDADGHEVIIFDIKTAAFDRLPETSRASRSAAMGRTPKC